MYRSTFYRRLFITTLLPVIIILQSTAQIRVVNMVPPVQSNETGHDAEPNIAVNPANRLQIVGTAFTPDPMSGPNAPIYISTDGGNTWSLNSIIPGNHTTFGTGDITSRFAGSGNQLYTGILRGDGFLQMNIFRIPDFTSTTVPAALVNRGSVDQPYVQAASVLGGGGATSDRVYAAINERATSPLSAGVDFSLNAFSTPPPGGFATTQVPSRPTTSRVQPGVRPSIHPSGIIYLAYYNQTSAGADVVVARDDQWATGATPFRNLLDVGDGLPGQRVVTGRTLPAFGVSLGNNRLVASNISICVDPRDAAIVYVAWADRVGTTDYTLHVRRSGDFGQNWSADQLTITNATNPALAVNTNGKVAFIYQQLTGTGTTQRWVTHLRRSTNGGMMWDDLVLSTSLTSNPPTAPGGVYLGDYLHIMAVDKDFYGIFSASNFPSLANFPQGVTYQRNANFSTNQLLGTDGVTPVTVSIDPFFFHVTELPASEDFFVRDFTLSSTNFDPGLEPSTYPWFYTNSDVWNKRSNAPGAFNANNQPVSEDPWQTTDGHNYAFARIHRKTAGAAKNVSLHYLISEFGTGSNYIHANTTADPVVAFSATDVEVTQASGYEWELPVTTSIHTCLAVEIATPEDPLIAPSLLGHAPGWSNGTDLMVLNDNNKAQRNMGVYHPPMGGGSVISYAAIHNPGLYTRNMVINWSKDPKQKFRHTVSSVSDKQFVNTDSNGISLLRMQPGETRYLKITVALPQGSQGESTVLNFNEIHSDMVLNGFAVMHQYSSNTQAVALNLQYETAVMNRMIKLYQDENALQIQKNDRDAIEHKRFSEKEYLAIAGNHIPLLKLIVGKLKEMGGSDPFELSHATSQLEQYLKSKNFAYSATSHESLLNALDVCITSLELAKGNLADILQTVYVQKEILFVLNEKKPSDIIKRLLESSQEFIDLYENRKITAKDYPEQLTKMIPALRQWVAVYGNNNNGLSTALRNLEENTKDSRSLQKAHLHFLSVFRSLLNI